MGISPIRPADSAFPGPGGARPAAASPATGPGFGKVIESLLESADARQVQAGQAVRDLAMGRTENVHGVMLSVAEADLTFRMILEIRNRLTDAYQEIMRMQV